MKKEKTRMRLAPRRLAASTAAGKRERSVSRSHPVGAWPTGEPSDETAIPAVPSRRAAWSRRSGPNSTALTPQAERSSNAPTPCCCSVAIWSSSLGANSSAKTLSRHRAAMQTWRRFQSRGRVLEQFGHRLAAVISAHRRQQHRTTRVAHGEQRAQCLCVQEPAVVIACSNRLVFVYQNPEREHAGRPRGLALFGGVVVARTRSNLRRAPQHPVPESHPGSLGSIPKRTRRFGVHRQVKVIESTLVLRPPPHPRQQPPPPPPPAHP